jgi:hypothetical protein
LLLLLEIETEQKLCLGIKMETTMKIKSIVGCLMISLGSMAFANSPEQVFQDYTRMVRANDFDNIATLFSTGAKEKVKQVYDAVLNHELDTGKMQIQKAIFKRKIKRSEILNTSADFFLSNMIHQLIASTQSQGVEIGNVDIVGKVDESSDRAHLIVRVFMTQNTSEFNYLQVYSFTRMDDKWAMEIPATTRQVLQMMQYQIRR